MSSNTRVLVTGVLGQVGGDLLPLLKPFCEVIPTDLPELDLTDTDAIRRFVTNARPDWIVHPAAFTAVDKAESEPELAYAINAGAPRALSELAAEMGIPMIHFSTDYVYNGSGTQPWVESDPTGPLGVYGASKLAGDEALAASGAAHLIFRTSWVYSSSGKNFLLTILRLAQEKEELRIVDDQHGAPTWSRDLALLVVHVMRWISERSARNGSSVQETVRAVQGVYHAVNSGETTWFGFAEEFLRCFAAARPEVKLARLVPVPSSAYPTPARRPSNSRLDCSRLKEVFGFTMPAWQDSAAAVMDEVLRSGGATNEAAPLVRQDSTSS
jgi:dTDP-4-dehydrorhamnose reductase